MTGWAFGGIGTGIDLSGILVLILRSEATWRAAWWAALLTTGYRLGEILGPLVVPPLLSHGYDQTLLVGAAVVLVAAPAAAALRVGFPHHLSDRLESVD